VLLFLDILYAYTALMLLFGCAHLCSILCGAALPAPRPCRTAALSTCQ